jgi:hypothetical protein
VIYWFGFVETLELRTEKCIIIRDDFPANITLMDPANIEPHHLTSWDACKFSGCTHIGIFATVTDPYKFWLKTLFVVYKSMSDWLLICLFQKQEHKLCFTVIASCPQHIYSNILCIFWHWRKICLVKSKGKVVPVHAMKAYGVGGIAPLILNLGTWWRWVVRFTAREKCHQYPLNIRLSLRSLSLVATGIWIFPQLSSL